jgi:hypothetical protein
MDNPVEAAVLRRLASDLEAQANEREAWIRSQSSFYVQYEDQGHTMTRARQLRANAEDYRQQADALESGLPSGGLGEGKPKNG